MALQKMRPIVGHSLLWAAGIAIIIVGIIFYTRQRLEMEKIASAQRFANAIASISYELPGRWQGSISYYSPGPWNRRVLNSEASLLITKSNSQLSGKLVYHGVEEKLSIGFRKGEKDSITIVMQGIDYKRLEGNGGFSLDTFYGIIKSGGLVEGNYRDAAGHSGSWSFKKIETDKQVKTVTNPATFKSDWNKTESPATKPAPEPAPVPQIYVDNITAKDASKASHSKFEGSGLPLTVAKVKGRPDPSVLDTEQASATDGTKREGLGNKMSVGITGGAASTTLTDHWPTVMACQAAKANPNYYPTLAKQRPLTNNETVKRHPTGGCFEMDLPDRLGGRGFVRIEKGRDFVVDRTTGAVLRLAVSNNAVYSWKPFPTEGSITN